MRILDPNYDWRIKLGGPEEESPLSVNAKLHSLDDRHDPSDQYPEYLTIGLNSSQDFLDKANSEELSDRDQELFKKGAVSILLNNELYSDPDRAKLKTNMSFIQNNDKDTRSKLLRKIRIGSDDTSIGLQDNDYFQHNVDTYAEQLSLAQLADMYIQYIETSGADALNSENWEDREINVFIDEGLGNVLKESCLEDYSVDHMTSCFNTMTPNRDPEIYSIDDFIRPVDGSVLPDEFRMPGSDARLELVEDTEEVFEYRSKDISGVQDHSGLAAMAHKWFNSFDSLDDEERF